MPDEVIDHPLDRADGDPPTIGEVTRTRNTDGSAAPAMLTTKLKTSPGCLLYALRWQETGLNLLNQLIEVTDATLKSLGVLRFPDGCRVR